jgi:hypothetical protein
MARGTIWLVLIVGLGWGTGCSGEEEGDAAAAGASGAGGSAAASAGGTGGAGAASGAAGVPNAGAGGGAGSAGSGGVGTNLPPYAPDFPLNVQIPAGMASDPRSDAIVARLKLNLTNHKVALSAHLDVPPIYEVTASDSMYTVTAGTLPQVGFRVPAEAVIGGGSDKPLLLLDPDHPEYGPFTELRLWDATVDHTQKALTAVYGGLFHYNNDGALLNPDGSPSHSIAFLGSGTGSGLSYLAGLVRPAEVIAGEIRHAIRFAYSNCDSSNQFRPPANKTDQPKNCETGLSPEEQRMDMGMRLQLDPSLDCSTRTVPSKADTSSETRFLRIFCKALQDYGMIMLDGTGAGGLFFYIEHSATANWQPVIGAEHYESFGYLIRDQDTPSDGLTRGPSDGIPWEKLRVLEKSAW